MTLRRRNRSVSSGPNSPAKGTGMARKKSTMATQKGEFVISRTSQPTTNPSIHNP